MRFSSRPLRVGCLKNMAVEMVAHMSAVDLTTVKGLSWASKAKLDTVSTSWRQVSIISGGAAKSHGQLANLVHDKRPWYRKCFSGGIQGRLRW